jgi:phosphatidylglycerophosphate synthase
MKLHRSHSSADWERIRPKHRSSIQNLAAKTNGIVTPPNFLSLVGLIVSLIGVVYLLQGSFWLAAIGLLLGRLFDIADGWVADKTGTKSPLGEIVDAVTDKIITVVTIVALYVTGISEWWLVTLLLLPQILITLLSLYRRRIGRGFQPSRLGKLSMAAAWISILSLILSETLSLDWISISATSLVIISSIMGAVALMRYSKDPA